MKAFGRVIGVAASLLICMAAYGAVSPQRVVTAIDDSQLTQVQENVPAVARRAIDQGLASDDVALTNMSLRFNMTAAQEAALAQLLADQQNPASPRYQQWLTPEQFGAQFGLAPADLQRISRWLTNQGFTVTEVARGGLFIRFTGTVAQVQKAFHTAIHRVTVDGKQHMTNLSAPQLPSAIAAVTRSITGLHDFHIAKPQIIRAPVAKQAAASPLYTSSISGSHFLAPGDYYTIYDENALLAGNLNGAGVTIAIMGDTDVDLSNVANFRSVSGLPATTPTVITYGRDPGTNSDTDEAYLDLEWSGATAPGAHLIYATGYDVIDNALTGAIDNDIAPILSISFGGCEGDFGQTYAFSANTLFQMANAQGQTVVASAGDSGATGCDADGANGDAADGIAPTFPTSSPAVTSVGGTMFNEGTGTYWSTTNGANMGSALSYIPEVVWNEDTSTGGLLAGGGGASAYFTKPYWQVGTGVPADSSRDFPDVSLDAAVEHDPYLVCGPGFCVNGYRAADTTLDAFGGTSASAPSFAGFLAVLEQKLGHSIGNANPTIYALANSPFYSTAFHDITSGNNASPCTPGATGCPAGINIGYSAGVGYDLASGWGSIDAFNFVTDWTLVTPLVGSTGQTVTNTALTGTPGAAVQGTNINLTSTTTSGSGGAQPTGTVQFLLDNVAQGSPMPINGAGVATFSLDTTSIPNGAHTVQAAYLGDATYAGSKGSFSIVITSSGVPDFSITPAATTVSVSSGSSTTVALTVNGLNSFSGSVTLTASSVTNEGSSFSANPIALLNTKTAGFTTLTLLAYKANAVGSTSASSRPAAPLWTETGSGIALAGILMLVLPRRRRFVGALAAVLSIGIFAVSGCGGGGNVTSTPPNTNTAPGTYTITVTGTGTSGTTSVTHTAVVTLIVQ